MEVNRSESIKQFKNKSFLCKVFSFVISFILCLIVFLFSILIIFKITIGNVSEINNTLISSKYYVFLTQEIRNKMYEYGDICGIPHSIFVEVITENRVSNDSHDYFDSCFTNKKNAINCNLLNNDLTEKITDYSKTINNVHTTPNQLKQNITVFVQQCLASYNDSINIPFFAIYWYNGI